MKNNSRWCKIKEEKMITHELPNIKVTYKDETILFTNTMSDINYSKDIKSICKR